MPFGGLLTAGVLGGSLLNGLLGYSASQNAAGVQAGSEQKVLDLTGQTVPQANGIIASGTAGANSTLQQFYQENMGLLAPYLQAGGQAEGQLAAGLAPGGQFNNTPTASEIMQQDPGYQFATQQGELAINRSLASQGTDVSGGQLKALTQFGQGNAQQGYEQAFQNYQQTQSNLFNRLNTLAGTGLSATTTGVNAGTQTGAGQSSNTLQGSGAQAGNLLQSLGIDAGALTGQANATASGYVGGANAVGGAISSGTSGLSQMALLQALMAKSGGTV